MKNLILVIILLFISNIKLHAQEKHIKGKVSDQVTGEPVAYASIALFDNQTIVDGVITNESGMFQLKTPKKFTSVVVSFMGYKTYTIDISEIKDPGNIVVHLELNDSYLEEIVVEGNTTTSQLKVDRKVVHLGNDIQQAGVNTLEAFDQIPEIDTDLATGTISLRGSDNIQVLINGKPSALIASEMLQQLPASSVSKVEIITSPSAKHRADGISGIINVVLKKNANMGLNMVLNTSVGTKRHGYGVQGNYNFGSINFWLNGSVENSEINNKQSITRNFTNGHFEQIYTPYVLDGNVYKISTGADFFVNDIHEFSLGLDFTEDTHSFLSTSNFFNVKDSDDYLYFRDSEHFHYNTIVNTNYRANLNGDDHFLELDYNINISNNDYPLTDAIDNTFLSKQFLTEDFILQAVALDYTFPITKNFHIESGTSWNIQDLKSTRVYTITNETPLLSEFNYNEDLLAFYALGKASFNKFSLQAGLRYEYFESTSKNDDTGMQLKRRFSNLFPSIHLSYVTSDNSSLNLGYSKRVSRPNFHHVNAFQIVNPLYIWEYNPDLNPELSDNIELSYQRRGKYFDFDITSFYRHRKNVILWTESASDNSQVFKYENTGVHNSFGFEGSISGKPTSFWNSRLSANYYVTNIDKENYVTWSRVNSSTIRFKNTFTINKKLTADITYLYLPKRQNPFNYIQARNRLDLSLRGKFVNDKLSVNLRVVDILNSYRYRRKSVTSNLTQTTNWDFQAQTTNYLLSLRYRLFENKGKRRSRKLRHYNEVPID